MPMLLLIDNYDSFTFNLAQYLGELGEDVKVLRNDAIDIAGIRALAPERIVISPGPGTPDDAGITLDVIRGLAGQIPILGVCLGHQALGQAFGGKVVRAGRIMHGKTSPIRHRGAGVFKGLPDPFAATRYHSLVVERASLPECLEVTAWTENPDGSMEEIMGLRHKTLAVEGVQFHPESIETRHGHDLLANFLKHSLPKAA
jgi:anthranilate synthase component 2